MGSTPTGYVVRDDESGELLRTNGEMGLGPVRNVKVYKSKSAAMRQARSLSPGRESYTVVYLYWGDILMPDGKVWRSRGVEAPEPL